MSADDSNNSPQEQQTEFSGRFPVRMPRYLHSQLAQIARQQGVSLNQFVSTAAVMAAGLNGGLSEPSSNPGWDRVGREQYRRLWNQQFG